MSKVKISFYCIKEHKRYNVGDEYTGKRTDIGHLLEEEKKTKVLTPKTKKKPANRK